MTRYTTKSKIKELKISRNKKPETVFAEIIKNPEKNIGEVAQGIALKEIRELVTKSWGEYENDYIKHGCLQADCELVPICGGGCLFDHLSEPGSACRKDFLLAINRGLMQNQA